MNKLNLIILIVFLPFVVYSQGESGYYINWDINHAETFVKPSIPISEAEARIINCYYVEFDAENRLKSVKYFFSGQPSNYSNYGAFELIRVYDEDHWTEKYRNTDGVFIENSRGIFEKHYHTDADGYWIRKEHYKKSGELLSEGVAVSEVIRNEKNEIATEIQLSINGDTIPDGNGFKIVHFSYNEDGLTLYRQNRNEKGFVVNGRQGYATVLFQFDQNGMFFEEQFLDENDTLFLHPRFDLAKINWRSFNQYGKPSRIYYIDDQGYPHKTRSYGIIRYRSNMTREDITYYDRTGEKTEDINGVARSVYNYDSKGKYLGKTNFDIEDREINQKTSAFLWPDHEITPIYKAFLKAYNTNDKEILEAFTKTYYKEDFEKNAAYWPSVFADYGQIEPFMVDDSETGDHRLAIWSQAKESKAWVMILLRLNEDNTKIIGKSVWRGMRPPGTLPDYSHLSGEEQISYLRDYLDKLESLDRFSGTVLIAKGDSILLEQAYGDRNKESNLKNNLNTSFNIASTSKTFTALAIAKLEEAGKLAYTDKLSKFIPEYPKDIADQVSIHHLLTHTSGIELDDYHLFNIDAKKARNVEDLVQAQIIHIDSLNEGRRKDFKVLNKFDYSNENFSLLGVIIERVSGMSYAAYIEQNIFEPLQMEHSFIDMLKLKEEQNIASGYSFRNSDYVFVGGQRQENDKMSGVFLNPAGGVYSSVGDLHTYFEAINNHKLISEKTKELMFKKHTKIYGYGFRLWDEYVGHNGTYRGVGSQFSYIPDSDHYIIVLSNYGAMAGAVVHDHIYDVIK
jgi:CubicO group peptidase (beta-lactamase class C family)